MFFIRFHYPQLFFCPPLPYRRSGVPESDASPGKPLAKVKQQNNFIFALKGFHIFLHCTNLRQYSNRPKRGGAHDNMHRYHSYNFRFQLLRQRIVPAYHCIHRCRSRQILGVRKIFARISPKLPEKFLGHFLCDFHVILGAIFSNQSTLGIIFARVFMEFAQIFSEFSKDYHICCTDFHWFCSDFQRFRPDFHQIRTFGDALAPLSPTPLIASHVAIITCRKTYFPQIVLPQFKAKPYLLGFQNLGCHCKILGCHFDTQKRLKETLFQVLCILWNLWNSKFSDVWWMYCWV